MGITSSIVAGLLFAGMTLGNSGAQRAAPAEQNGGVSGNPAQLFENGRQALSRGQLTEAERDFRGVLRLDPQSWAAYANLGVVYMRGKHWDKALQSLEVAERLMPQEPGVRLNIGLTYYRQNEYLKAIPEFESVVRDQPNALEPRYLLGFCYFFAERWGQASATLEPLWSQKSDDLPYLYVLSNAAHRAGKKELDDRATEQLIRLSNGTPEYHLFAGKYHLNLDQYDLALTDFKAAAEADPKLPFVHFNLGLVHLKKQEYAAARDEFLKDAAIEPDMALNYEELGEVYWLMQDDASAEKSYREALKHNPRLVDSRIGLAKIYQRQRNYAAALAEASAAVKADPARPDVHYVRGQVLLHLGRKEEAKKELAAANRISSGQTNQTKTGSIPSPELMQDSQ